MDFGRTSVYQDAAVRRELEKFSDPRSLEAPFIRVPMARLFIALPLDPAVAQLLAKIGQRVSSTDAIIRHTPTDNLHVTLKFLGNVDDEDLPVLADEVRSVAATIPPFDATFDKLGVFERRRQVTIVWAGSVFPVSAAFNSLAVLLDTRLGEIGFRREKREPLLHVTLVRVKEDHSAGKLARRIAAIDCPLIRQLFSKIGIYESHISSENVRYEIRQEFTLGSP